MTKKAKESFKKGTPRKFVLFVDTNSISTDEKLIELLPTEFLSKWEEVSRPGDVTLAIPDIVFLELASQKQRHWHKEYASARTRVKNVKEALPLAISVPKEKSRDEFKTKIVGILEKKLDKIPYCKKIDFPYSAMTPLKWRKINEAAIWRYPPFKEDKEGSGYRDALILETVSNFHKKVIHADIAFLSQDVRLVQAMKEHFKGVDNFGIFATLGDFTNYLAAARAKLTPAFLHKAINFADKAFNEYAGESGLLATLIAEHSFEIGKMAFDNNDKKVSGGLTAFLSPGAMYECSEVPISHILKPKFLSIVGADDKFHWSTQILIAANYTSPKTLLFSFGTESPKKSKLRVISIKVEWEASVTKDHKFENIKILEKSKDNELFIDTDPLTSETDPISLGPPSSLGVLD